MKQLFTLLCAFIVCFGGISAQAIHVVNSANDNDDGVCNSLHCSLREAINAANTNIGPDSIEFDIPGAGPHIITVTDTLPGIRDSFLVIDGTTEPGNFPMAGLIILDGTALSPGTNHGLVIFARKTEIYGLQIRNFPADGIQLFGGISDAPFLSNITIGAPNKGNVVIRNGGHGIEGPVDRNVTIQSNYVGTDLQFNAGLGNAWDGILVNVLRGSNVRIGGSRALNQQNYLCSNMHSGLRVTIEDGSQFLPGFSITGNVIGTDAGGTRNLGNLGFTFTAGVMAGGGISIEGTGPMSIGGTGALANIIAFNYSGVYITIDNRKTILENFFYCNTFKGIHLDSGANNGILPPALLCLQGSALIGTAPTGTMVDVYLHNNSLCPSAPCQGLTLLGRVTAGGLDMWSFDTSPWPGSMFTAIAQDAQGNSSEFAACILDPNVVASNGGPYCYGDSIYLFSMLDTAVGNVTFEWFGPNGYTSFDQNPADATEPGIYTVVADIMGCGADTAFTEVVVYPLASDTLTRICVDDSLVINGTVYNVNNSIGQELLPGAGQFGCDSLVVIDLNVDFPITGRILATRPSACAGDSVGYWFDLVGGNGPYDVVFTTGLGQPDTLFGIHDGFGDTLVATADVHFEILDIITSETLCEPTLPLSDSILVSDLMMSPLVSDFAGFGISCFGENDGMIALNVTGGVGNILYDWNLAALNGDVASQLSAGTYSVTISDAAGCDLTFETFISQPPMFESITRTEPTTCGGVNDGSIFIDAVLGARGSVQYSLNGDPLAPLGPLPFEISNLPSGIVDLVLIDSIGCTDEVSIFIPLAQSPSIDLGGDRSILTGDSVLLDFNTSLIPESILWQPSGVLSCPDCPTTYAFPDTSLYITLTLSDSLGCSATDSVLILVFVPRKVFIPNVFSPNQDQINDIFFLQGDEEFVVKIEYMIIADPWGDVVFEKTNFSLNDPNEGWDGTMGGEPMNPGVFTYLTRIRFIDGEIIPYSGTVTLIR